jgi:hypothetical protein
MPETTTSEAAVIARALAVTALLALVTPAGGLLACGDKFLVPGRGARFPVPRVDRGSATVLLYARPGSTLDENLRRLSVEARLRTAGYRPTLVTSETGLAEVLRDGTWDVVVTDLADGPAILGRLPPTAAPTVVPVAYGASRAALEQARRHYRAVLTSPTRSQAFLQTVDRAVVARARARVEAAGASE